MLSTPPAFVLSQDQTLHKIYEELNQALNYLLKKLPIAMLFIPIDVLNKKFSLLKHLALIMLHDYLHCLVFKEQSCSALLSKCLSLQATHLFYRIQLSLSRTFLKFFSKLFGVYSGLPIKACWAVLLPCLSATCIILHESEGIVNTFFEKNMKKLRLNSKHKTEGGGGKILPAPTASLHFDAVYLTHRCIFI